MNDANITRVKLDTANLPETDWTKFDARTEAENTAAALSDPDSHPTPADQLAQARRMVNVPMIREKFGLSQEQFARRFGLRLEMVRGWEDKSLTPDPAAVTLLRIIWAEPDAVRRVVAAE